MQETKMRDVLFVRSGSELFLCEKPVTINILMLLISKTMPYWLLQAETCSK